MGGPSLKEIQSDDTLTKYIDGEITDELMVGLFERELSKNPKLRQRLEDMIATKAQIKSIFGKGQVQPTEFVLKEIDNIVRSSSALDTFKTADDLDSLDAEVLISSLIDGELGEPDLSRVEKLIAENDTYRNLYDQLLATKINVSEYIFPQNLEPSNKVKREIESLVAGEFEKTASPLADVPVGLAASPQPKNIIKLGKRGVVSSFNYYAQRLVPLAAVFVAGLYISPAFVYTNAAITLRGGGSEIASNKDFGFVSIVQSEDQSANSAQTNILLPQISFHLLLTAPTSGEMFISLETSNQTDVSKLPKGKTVQQIGVVEVGQLVRYPAAQDLTVDETDKLLRIDIEIRSDNKIFSFTEFVTIDQG